VPGAQIAASPSASFLEISRMQDALAEEGLDAWLLYDFRGSNPIAADLTGVLRQGGHLATRRWFYLIPATGEPRGLVHAIESQTLAHLPGHTRRYAGREQLKSELKTLLDGVHRIAMEYSPECAIPYVSRVDAGTLELVRACGSGIEVVSSGDLIQRFSSTWGDEEIASHQAASEKLHRIKDRAFEEVARALRDDGSTTEYAIQQSMVRWFAEEGLISDAPPNVSATRNAGNPHYLPTAGAFSRIGDGDLVLLDLWGKLEQPGAVYADITWMGYTGTNIPARFNDAFAAIRDARDAAVRLVQTAIRSGRDLRGWEVDRAASTVLRERGYGDRILHRTGHSLGQEVHGNGVNMDDYETHDDRRLLPGAGFTIEPGVYFPDFGERTEINMIVRAADAVVSGPLQAEILALV
jgi:Xaa-Pro aminopeptidase